jgi:hypothetical protein
MGGTIMLSWGRHEYGKVFDNWPRTPEGDTVEPAFLVHCQPLDMEAEMIQSMLESYGIPSIRCLPGDGAFGQLILGMSGNGADIFVPQTQLAEAQELLKGEPEDDGLQE